MDECPSDMINAKYQWSELNPANKDLKDLTAEDFLKVRYVIIRTVVSILPKGCMLVLRTFGLYCQHILLSIIENTDFLLFL